jgi:hypothetical protein
MPVRWQHPIEALFEWAIDFGGCVFLVVGLTVFLLFLSTISRTVSRVRRANRRIEPPQVWLNLLPFFNLVWLPITVDRVAASIKAECEDRGLDEPGESYSRMTGLTWLSLSVFMLPAVVVSRDLDPPCCALVFVPLVMIFWVVYWVQLADYARRLKATKYVPPADEGW